MNTLPATSLLVASVAVMALTSTVRPASRIAPDWRTDPAWYHGKAEWALYDAVRPLEGGTKHSETTIFTNKQQMDPATTTKAGESNRTGNIEVFKHNVSEIIPTGNYAFRYLSTAFVRTDNLEVFKLAVSTQEDCGSSYKQFVNDDGTIDATSFSYHPNQGAASSTYDAPANLAYHDALSLTLRDYPFEADDKPVLELALVPDQTWPRATPAEPALATVRYAGRETLDLPYGSVDAHHLIVEHAPDGRATQSEFWFAADPAMRHVMVRYEGPYGVTYELKRLDWWAYWGDPRPE